MPQPPNIGRIRINFDGSQLKIMMPFKENGCIILFIMAWLGFWAIAESIAIYDRIYSENIDNGIFSIYWIIFWTIAGICVFFALLWNLYGHETLTVNQEFLQLDKVYRSFRIRHRVYQLNSIKNLRVDEEKKYTTFVEAKSSEEFFGFSGGKLQFDWEGEKIVFGVGLSVLEARFIIEEMKKRGFYKENC